MSFPARKNDVVSSFTSTYGASRGVGQQKKIPCLVPVPMKTTPVEDMPHNLKQYLISLGDLSLKNPKLYSTGTCECGRKIGDHTPACTTKEFIKTRDPKCGCDECHI